MFKAAETKNTFNSRENILDIVNGTVVFAQRYSFTVGCKMHFQDYPFDTQRCEFPISLMDSIRTNISIRWLTPTVMAKGRALHLADDFKPLQFFLKKPLTVETKSRI
ncbi:uncharacterized protein TNIN_126041 [Trichonephila inaurata madagascariensis]|uniref:Neurotransmitter-gated ion-channel ligand-binding domain-containing protein n=1 Tax=Trichonephila inaurata madagascariensis TaxID=2747483 RepID=A0A8X6Y2J5_9ARAC|nr:uncharacterized protein TNIN_126041 [Trichonephila inaurata madagascariensis]